jgi:hypothetical protein
MELLGIIVLVQQQKGYIVSVSQTNHNQEVLIGSQNYPFKINKTKKVSHTLNCVIDLPHLIPHSQTLQVTPT